MRLGVAVELAVGVGLAVRLAVGVPRVGVVEAVLDGLGVRVEPAVGVGVGVAVGQNQKGAGMMVGTIGWLKVLG